MIRYLQQPKFYWLTVLVLIVMGWENLSYAQSSSQSGQTDGNGDEIVSEEKSAEAMILEATKMLEEAKLMLDEAKIQDDGSQKNESDSGFTKFDALIAGLSIFVLAVFVGFEVITKVPPTLHTPLMSGSNAISGITLVGALIVAARNGSMLGVLAVLFAMINVIGGFWVTHRMLSMFKR